MARKKQKKRRAKAAPSKWPKLLRVSEEMKHWSAMLEEELAGWPGVTLRPMFGMIGFYRRGTIFAAAPRTRALGSANAVIFRFDSMPPGLLRRARKDRRIASERDTPDTRWHSFELGAADDLRDALWWLNRAYAAAITSPASGRPRRRTARR